MAIKFYIMDEMYSLKKMKAGTAKFIKSRWKQKTGQ